MLFAYSNAVVMAYSNRVKSVMMTIEKRVMDATLSAVLSVVGMESYKRERHVMTLGKVRSVTTTAPLQSVVTA